MLGKRIIWVLLLALGAAVSCSRNWDFLPDSGGSSGAMEPPARQAVTQVRNVMIMISGGHNSLSSYLSDDLADIAAGYLPEGTDAESNVLMVLARLPENYYSTTSVPVLYRMYRDEEGSVVRDTLKRWGADDRLFGGTVIHDALQMVRDRVPARSYGVVLSSHASGWMPCGYYNKPSDFERRSIGLRSIGQDEDGSVSVEMDLMDFAAAIPFRLDYMVLDCCLSGGVEVAWALSGKADKVAFTQTETMADGFDYVKIVRRLLEEKQPNPLGVCEDFYNYYKAKTGVYQSATISLVDTRNMEPLSTLCKSLFQKYRSALNSLDGDKVQGYFRYDRHYFYDLKDILVKAGITPAEEAQLDEALSACVLYKAATPWFMKGSTYGFELKHVCGLSMYLPSMGTTYLDNYYKNTISWNQATALVE